MKGLAAAALAVAIALPVCAQRGGGGHAGFAGHGASGARSAPAFHGSFAPSAQYHYSYGGAPMARAPISYPSSMRLLAPGVHYAGTAPIVRPSFYHPTHPITITKNHTFFIGYPAYPYAYAYPSYVYGYLPPDMLDDSYDNEALQPAPPPDYSSAYPQPMPEPDGAYAYPQPAPQPDYGYPQPVPQPGYGYPQPVPAYPAYPQPMPEGAYAYPAPPSGYYVPQPAAPQMQYVPGSASTVILIYKDGRPPEQIQNYLATRSTLTVLDGGRRREIPLSELNIPATVSANHQTGVDFQLPGGAP
jgi:hypothetical protein